MGGLFRSVGSQVFWNKSWVLTQLMLLASGPHLISDLALGLEGHRQLVGLA